MFGLMRLPYAYNALEPYIDAKTVEIHYTRHHQGYVNNLNQILIGRSDLMRLSVEEILKNLDAVTEDIRMSVRFNAGGVANHNLFWQIMKPNGGGPATGLIAGKIIEDFGSFDSFREQFVKTAVSVMGSGWCWLVLRDGKLDVLQSSNHRTPLSLGMSPLLVCDVWEHSFYLKYMWNKKEYVENFFNLVNWDRVNELFDAAK